MSFRWRPDHWGLSSRIVALSLLLLLLVQAAVFSVVRIGIDQSARRQVGQELQVGERVWRRLLDQNAQKLSQGATVLAADFGFRSAVNSGDTETIRSALEKQWRAYRRHRDRLAGYQHGTARGGARPGCGCTGPDARPTGAAAVA